MIQANSLVKYFSLSFLPKKKKFHVSYRQKISFEWYWISPSSRFRWNLLPCSRASIEKNDEIYFFAHNNSIFLPSAAWKFYFLKCNLISSRLFSLHSLLSPAEAIESLISRSSLHCRGNNFNCIAIPLNDEFTLDGNVVCSVSHSCTWQHGNCCWRRYCCSSSLCTNYGEAKLFANL